jgi:hypothetical protein
MKNFGHLDAQVAVSFGRKFENKASNFDPPQRVGFGSFSTKIVSEKFY